MKRTCIAANCNNHATFKKPQGNPEYCRRHFHEGYIPLSGNYQTCRIKGCRSYASHGIRGGIYKLCRKHSNPRIHLNRRYSLCHFPDCKLRRGRDKFCGNHEKVSLPDSYLKLVGELEDQEKTDGEKIDDETVIDNSIETNPLKDIDDETLLDELNQRLTEDSSFTEQLSCLLRGSGFQLSQM